MGFLGSIGKVFTSVLPKIIPVAAKVLLGPVGSTALDIFKQVAGGLTNKTGLGGLFSGSLPLSLPNPLSALNGLLGNIGGKFNGIGDFLRNIGNFLSGNRNIGGQQITVPHLGDRGAAVGQAASAIAGQLASGGYDSAIGRAAGAGNVGRAGGIYDTGMSRAQQDMLRALDADPNTTPGEKARMVAQFNMQNHQLLMEFISNMQKMMHDTAKSIIGNIR